MAPIVPPIKCQGIKTKIVRAIKSLCTKNPNGRWIEFSYYAGTSLVYQAKDISGRTVTYTYDGNGNLATVPRM